MFLREEELGSVPMDQSALLYGESLVLRLKRACHFFYAAHAQSGEITQIFLSGDGANDRELLQFILKSFNKPTYIVNPFRHIKCAEGVDMASLSSSASMYLTACGLAKRGC